MGQEPTNLIEDAALPREEAAIPSTAAVLAGEDTPIASEEAAIQSDLAPRRPDAGTRAAPLGLPGRVVRSRGWHCDGGEVRGEVSRAGCVGGA